MISQNLIEAYISDADSIPRNHRIYIAFILYWALFEALIKDKTGVLDNTKRAIEETKKDINYLKSGWNKIARTNWVGCVALITQYCPIGDKRYDPARKPVNISDPLNPDLGELIEVFYRIRCNFLHGNEDFRSKENIELYTACRDVLAQWLKQTV